MGVDTGSAIVDGRKIYTSSDGITWTAQPDLPMSFIPRHGFTTTVFNNKVWLMGGVDATGTYYNDVWSFDGTTWTQAANAAWTPQRGQATLVFNNKMWVIGGNTASMAWNVSSNQIWSTPDGITWTQVGTLPTTMDLLPYPAFEVFDGKMWIVSKRTSGSYQEISANSSYGEPRAVWSSPNGITWTRTTLRSPVIAPSWPTRNSMQIVAVPTPFGACPADRSIPLDSPDSLNPIPDLVVSKVWMNNGTQIAPGTYLRFVPFSITIRNTTEATANIGPQGLHFDMNFPVQGWTLPTTTVNVGQIPGCSTYTAVSEVTLTALESGVLSTIGSYPVNVQMNPNQYVPETNYTNNTATGYFTVQ